MVESRKKFVRFANDGKIDHLIKVIQDYIIDNDLAPGMQIPAEREMAKQLGVSRFSLREDLRVAEFQGLIEISRGCRPKVAKPSSGPAAKMIGLTLQRSEMNLLSLVEVRQCRECQIAYLAAQKAGQSHIFALRQTIEQMEQNTTRFTWWFVAEM